VIRALGAGILVATGGAVLVFGLGMLDLRPGLLAAAAAAGWAVALAVVWGGGGALAAGARRVALSGGLGAASIASGLALVWAWSRVEGGVLAPLDYLDQRFGLLAFGFVVIAAVAASFRGR
jgi:hypothetical protein